MTRRVSPLLEVRATAEGERICCTRCGQALGPAGAPWKPHATLVETPMRGAGGAPYSAGEAVLLRRFGCPGCGALLDTETALPGDPFLSDIVHV